MRKGRGDTIDARRMGLWIALAVLLIAVGAATLAGCGRGVTVRKVAIIGIDAMDWQLADPLMEAGRLPNLQRLVEAGSRRELRSFERRMKSPIIWATIGTGKGPQKHGISDFLEGTDDEPLFNSHGWRARPVWDILGGRGRTVGVINWMVTWPALPANGYWVSDRITFVQKDGFDRVEHAAYPEELIDELEPVKRPFAETTDEEIARFMNGDLWPTTESFDVRAGVEGFRGIYASDETVLEVAKYLLESREQPDFFAVYINGLDVCCHRYWGQMDPSTIRLKQSEELLSTFSDLIQRYYERIDGIIGDLVAELDEDTTIIVCSDHGFRGPYRSSEGLRLGTWMHRPEGLLVAAGPGVARSGPEGDASVFDITPTVLALLGEPVGRDMDGYVLIDVLDDAFLESNPVEYIETHERPGETQDGEPMTSPVDDEIKERLRSLGYID